MKVLVVEDEKEIRDLIAETLTTEGFEVVGLEHGDNMFLELERHTPQALLLDQILPGKSGVEILKEIRLSETHCRLPVLMVTGLSGEGEIVSALDLGADDYVTKPFMPKALAARIKSVVRRVGDHPQTEVNNEDKLVNGQLIVDFASHKVMLKNNEVSLTLTEFKILGELLRESGRVLTRDKLREKALGNLNVTDRTIDVHMASLRKKLEETGQSIQTVRGVGYRFAAPATA